METAYFFETVRAWKPCQWLLVLLAFNSLQHIINPVQGVYKNPKVPRTPRLQQSWRSSIKTLSGAFITLQNCTMLYANS